VKIVGKYTKQFCLQAMLNIVLNCWLMLQTKVLKEFCQKKCLKNAIIKNRLNSTCIWCF